SVNPGSNPGPPAGESASNRCVFVVSSLAGIVLKLPRVSYPAKASAATRISEWPPTLAIPPDWPKVAVWSAARATASIRPRLPKKLEPCGWMPFSGLPDGPFRWGIVQRQNRGLVSIRAVVVKRFQANNSNFCRSRARASLRDQPLALPAWDQQEETEQSDSRTDRGRAIDTRVQSELVSSIVPRGTSLRWSVAPTVWRSSLRLSAPFPLSSGTRFHHSTCDA